ncbi:hypothetical protein ACFVYE_20515 [Streptomyces sp. NPDC058239]|uniref:hypothetical protein n=1 Tax=unclassified Streptomyces TaxID=2593676 RepID=UPI003662EAED
MDAIQQHMIDSYRAAQHGELPPPLPGRHDWGVVREARDRRRFDAVIAGRPARRRWRTALRALFTRRHRTARPGVPSRCGNSSPSGV